MGNNHYSVIESAIAQEAYCNKHGCPVFIPSTGYCPNCGGNIFEPYNVRRGSEYVTLGIDVEEAGRRLITGCPLCGRTFCE